MKKKFLAGLAVGVMMLGMSGVVGATVLNFEGLTTYSADDLAYHQGYGGFTWDNGWCLYNDNVYAAPAHSGDYAIVVRTNKTKAAYTFPQNQWLQ